MSMHNLRDRAERIERQLAPSPSSVRQVEKDAETFRSKICAMADALTDGDADPAPEARLQMSAAQHFSWAMRFHPAFVTIEYALTERGRAMGHQA